MTDYLVWTDSKGKRQQKKLGTEDLIVGRKSDCDIVLIDPRISRNHAKISLHDNRYHIEDLQSTHGTYLNEIQIESMFLQPGDRITFGASDLELRFSPRESSPSSGSNQTQSISDLTSLFVSGVSEQQSDLEKISCLLDIQYKWEQHFSADETFGHILNSALELSGAERGFILLRKGSEFEYARGKNSDGKNVAEPDFRTSRTVVERVSKSRRPVFETEGLSEELARQDSIISMNLKAIACLPLQAISPVTEEPEILGILYLDSSKPMHALSGLDEKILMGLAQEVGNVLEKVQLVKTLEEKRSVESELALAREAQLSLLPHSLPEVESLQVAAFSQPAHQVGGDFYDFLADPKRLAAVLADVSGKGISAALLSASLQGALQLHSKFQSDLGALLTAANQFLCDRTANNRFATLFTIRIDSDGQGAFLSAGHNPALHHRLSTQEIELMESSNLLLGAFPAITYESQPIQVEVGDTILVYSDGVTEAENPAGEMFGDERLQKVLKAEAEKPLEGLKSALLDQIGAFTQEAPQTDDMTFLLIRRSA